MIQNSRVQDNTLLRQLVLTLFVAGLGVAGAVAIIYANPIVPFVALVALVALPWLLTRVYADILLVIATIMLLPYAVAPVRLAFLTPTLLEGGLLLLYVAWLLRALSGSQGGVSRTRLDALILCFLGATGFAFVLGLGRDFGTDVIHNYIKLLLSIGIFFAASNVVRDAGGMGLVLRALVLIGGAQAALGVVLWRLPDALTTSLLSKLSVIGYPTDRIVRYVEDNPALGERAVGTQVDPNSFGGLLVIVTVITGVALLARKPILPRWMLGGFFLVDMLALVLTNSRSALLGVIVAGAMVATMRYRRLWGWGVALGGVVLALGVGSGYFARLASGIRFEDQASLMRLAEYRNAIDIIGRYPAFGVGFGTAGELDLTTGVSSVYLTVAERTGLIGLALFIAVMMVFFLTAVPAIRQSAQRGREIKEEPVKTRAVYAPMGTQYGVKERNERVLTLAGEWSILDTAIFGGTAAILGALFVGLVDHYYFNIEFPHMAALFWLVVGLTLAARRLLIEPKELKMSV